MHILSVLRTAIGSLLDRLVRCMVVLIVLSPLWACNLHLDPQTIDAMGYRAPMSPFQGSLPPERPLSSDLPPMTCLFHCPQHTFIVTLTMFGVTLACLANRWQRYAVDSLSRLAEPPLLPPPRLM